MVLVLGELGTRFALYGSVGLLYISLLANGFGSGASHDEGKCVF
jgi:hypothetical protein